MNGCIGCTNSRNAIHRLKHATRRAWAIKSFKTIVGIFLAEIQTHLLLFGVINWQCFFSFFSGIYECMFRMWCAYGCWQPGGHCVRRNWKIKENRFRLAECHLDFDENWVWMQGEARYISRAKFDIEWNHNENR